MVILFGVRDKDGRLRIFNDDKLVKNLGRGYWLPEYNSGNCELPVEKEAFPEISWEDAEPTKLVLANLSESEDLNDNVFVPGCIEVHCQSSSSPYNSKVGSKLTIFVNDISYFEPNNNEKYNSSIHMKNGDLIICEETVNKLKRLIVACNHEDS